MSRERHVEEALRQALVGRTLAEDRYMLVRVQVREASGVGRAGRHAGLERRPSSLTDEGVVLRTPIGRPDT